MHGRVVAIFFRNTVNYIMPENLETITVEPNQRQNHFFKHIVQASKYAGKCVYRLRINCQKNRS